ncbi:MAG: hypothetical protein AAF353_12835 [Pseudomonadota bacterium]
MNDKMKNRRKLLLGMGVGGAAGLSQLPDKWVGPVVNSVTLPAHASTTGDGGEPGGGETVGPFAHRDDILLGRDLNDLDVKRTIPEKLLDGVIETAHAGIEVVQIGFPGDLCITSPDGSACSARLLVRSEGEVYYFSADGTIGVPMSFPNTGGCPSPDLLITVPSIDETGANYSITGWLNDTDGISGGSGCPISLACLQAEPS